MQSRRTQAQVDEADDAVAAAFEAGLDVRQAAGQAGEEAVVEAADPCLAAPDDTGADAVGAGDDLERRFDVDNTEAGDEVATQLPGKCDIVSATHDIEQQCHAAGELVRRQAEVFARDELGCDLEDPVDLQIAQDASRNVAHAGDARSRKAQRDIDGRCPQSPLTRRTDTIKPGGIECRAVSGEQVIETRGGKGAVENGF